MVQTIPSNIREPNELQYIELSNLIAGCRFFGGDIISKQEILNLLNHALELEHAANIQYLSHAEIVDGEGAETIIARLKEIAGDEKDHAEKFRTLIGALGGVPSMGIAPTYAATSVKEILEVNLKGEKEAVDTYRKIVREVEDREDPLLRPSSGA